MIVIPDIFEQADRFSSEFENAQPFRHIVMDGFERIDLPPGRESLSRRSFALYYYTSDRPADETAIEHSTASLASPGMGPRSGP